jgi:NADPH:quinone reductase-like Zn-dependent oxidoreductase
MKAVVLNGITYADDVQISEVEMPAVKDGWVLIKVKAFGLNHSESILRLNEIRADYIQKPVIPGIECVGEVADKGNTRFENGQRVVALMGGMGRSFNGSYAEYALLPAHHVFAVNSHLPWDKLAAVPETFFTAWGSLFDSLRLEEGESLLVRGATCALGYAAIMLAKGKGCKVIATTHKLEKMQLLHDTQADECVLDDGKLAGKVKGVDKVLELVGPKTLYDSLRCVKKGGIVCNTGILGGVYYLNQFDPIKDIPSGVYLTGFFSNYPTQAVIDEMFAFISEKGIVPKAGKTFKFNDIALACKCLDEGGVNGKIVVVI